MKFTLPVPAVLMVLTLLFGPAGVQARATATTPSQRFTLFYSNDVRGETEPCG